MIKKIIAGVAAGVTVVMLAATPSLAGTYGNLETLNPNGGTNATNGIKIDYAAGNVQVTRNTYQQIYPAQADVDEAPGDFCSTTVMPDPDNQGCVSSAFVVSLISDGNYNFGPIVIGAPDPYSSLPAAPLVNYWDTITSESTVGADGSGTIHSVMTYTFDWCNDTCSGTLTLDVVLSYTYPNQYYTVDTTTSWVNNSGNTNQNDWLARVYYYQDATLSGDDDGNQFSDVDANGNLLVGVVRPDGTALEGVRSYANNPINTFAGYYACPVDIYEFNCTDDASQGGWISNGYNLPDSISTDEAIDNGFSVQAGDTSFWLNNIATTPVTSKFDLLFMACEISSPSATDCIEKGGYVPPALPNTGVDTASVVTTAIGTFALVMVGAALMVIRRRRNA